MLGSLKRRIAIKIAQRNLAEFKGRYSRAFFNSSPGSAPIRIVSMSGDRFFWDQLYSICTFYRYVGRPLSWTIYTDGSYTKDQINELQNIPFVEVASLDLNRVSIDRNYLIRHPFLRRLEIYAAHQISGTTIFCDSDILFFPKFRMYKDCFLKGNWFLGDEAIGYFDADYPVSITPVMYAVNAGFLVMNTTPKWRVALDYINDRIRTQKPIGHWSEQTAIHVMISGDETFKILDPRYFVLAGKDSFSIDVIPDWRSIALRHFVGPVRHKMWQTSPADILAGE